MIRLFGTLTSPYVRRVRIVAQELGQTCELVDTSTDAGQVLLRERSPLWKVPAAEIGGELVFDSGVICQHLVERHGGARLARVVSLTEHNRMTVIDGALDALINCLYLGRDGVLPEHASYLHKQRERAESACSWIDGQVVDGWISERKTLGLPEIALATMAAWMRFRRSYPVEQHPGIVACLERCEALESFAMTRPGG